MVEVVDAGEEAAGVGRVGQLEARTSRWWQYSCSRVLSSPRWLVTLPSTAVRIQTRMTSVAGGVVAEQLVGEVSLDDR